MLNPQMQQQLTGLGNQWQAPQVQQQNYSNPQLQQYQPFSMAPQMQQYSGINNYNPQSSLPAAPQAAPQQAPVTLANNPVLQQYASRWGMSPTMAMQNGYINGQTPDGLKLLQQAAYYQQGQNNV